MIKIGILGDIGSGKSFIAKSFGYPVFNADKEVSKLYQTDKKIFNKLKKVLPKYFKQFPINKSQVLNAILENKTNLKKIIRIVHFEVKKKMKSFILKNKKKKLIILDIPLLLENKINNKSFILIFVQSKKTEILKRLKKRKNYNQKILKLFKDIQLPLDYKKKKSQFIIKNNFSKKSAKRSIKKILNEILNERNYIRH
jgi:dephospho-CoA kinase